MGLVGVLALGGALVAPNVKSVSEALKLKLKGLLAVVGAAVVVVLAVGEVVFAGVSLTLGGAAPKVKLDSLLLAPNSKMLALGLNGVVGVGLTEIIWGWDWNGLASSFLGTSGGLPG